MNYSNKNYIFSGVTTLSGYISGFLFSKMQIVSVMATLNYQQNEGTSLKLKGN